MAPLITSALVLFGLLSILRLAVNGRLTGFNSRRARLTSRSLHGSNAALMLSAAALAGLALSIAANAQRWNSVSNELAPVLTVGLVVALIALVAFRSADAVLGVVGFGAETISAGFEHGTVGALSVLVLAMLLLVLLGFIRGFVRSA
jgi:ABC-type methionine transport system permease subunit